MAENSLQTQLRQARRTSSVSSSTLVKKIITSHLNPFVLLFSFTCPQNKTHKQMSKHGVANKKAHSEAIWFR